MSAAGIELSVVIATHDNLPVLRQALESWRRFAAKQPVELIVVEDGCTDGTAEYLAELTARGWDGPPLRAVHEDDAHELVCTNRGFREARGSLVLSWHDDMFVRARWFVPELLATFRAYDDIGMMSLSRGLLYHPVEAPIRTWDDTVDWRRMESTLGPAPFNWARIQEVDGVMRPWIVRTACIDRVGPLDEAFRPTEWDESDLAYRIRQAGWKVATHGYERDGAYVHQLSTTYARTPSQRRMDIGLRNGLLFYSRWRDAIRAEDSRVRRTWPRRASPAGWMATARQAARFAMGRRDAA
ncbi:MAG TPA: glycosyltransferase [Longimicrobium sp.]|nr:glycosyltransferase [Longimicrobium sp.]